MAAHPHVPRVTAAIAAARMGLVRLLGLWCAGCAAAWAAPLSVDAATVLRWISDTGDNHNRPFLVIDKRTAHVWVFDARARPLGDSPVLLGVALGDVSVPGIGQRPIPQIRPAERITPAGRFNVQAGRNLTGEDILWIDYGAAVSLHRVRPTDPREQRLQRLASPSPKDNRITFGCVNVPTAFYNGTLSRLFSQRPGIAYVIPETLALGRVFPLGNKPRSP